VALCSAVGSFSPRCPFHSESVVLMPKATSAQFPEQQLMGEFEFGFVQGLKSLDVHLDYWGQIAANGRSVLHISLPNVFEIDTDAAIQPWTRTSASRFQLRNVTQKASKFNALGISSDFTDHPMYVFAHTVQHTLPTNVVVPHFIRSVGFKREFRTIFCARSKKDGTFTPISSTVWIIDYDHTVDYSQNGANRTVTSSVSTKFPSGGSPSNVNATDRQIMGMADRQLLRPALSTQNPRSAVSEWRYFGNNRRRHYFRKRNKLRVRRSILRPRS